jgi:hypothetical protein
MIGEVSCCVGVERRVGWKRALAFIYPVLLQMREKAEVRSRQVPPEVVL